MKSVFTVDVEVSIEPHCRACGKPMPRGSIDMECFAVHSDNGWKTNEAVAFCDTVCFVAHALDTVIDSTDRTDNGLWSAVCEIASTIQERRAKNHPPSRNNPRDN